MWHRARQRTNTRIERQKVKRLQPGRIDANEFRRQGDAGAKPAGGEIFVHAAPSSRANPRQVRLAKPFFGKSSDRVVADPDRTMDVGPGESTGIRKGQARWTTVQPSPSPCGPKGLPTRLLGRGHGGDAQFRCRQDHTPT